jgi:hypothetical protein
MRIGIIQTRGLGDIVIAAPIAMYYINRGCEVIWPIDSEFTSSFIEAFPKITFLPIYKSQTGNSTFDFFYSEPLRLLNLKSCDAIICLYSHLSGIDLGNKRLQESLPFDAYKYAIAKVPLEEKWNFNPLRNSVREGALFKLLDLDPNEKYIVIQDEGSNFKVDLNSYITEKDLRKVYIKPVTENIFDWIGILERSMAAYLVDSVYANLIEQLDLKIKKNLYFRSSTSLTPTFKTSWNYI